MGRFNSIAPLMLERIFIASHIINVHEIQLGVRKEGGHNPDLIQGSHHEVVIIRFNVLILISVGIIHLDLRRVSLT
jgi:hypothetical protein